MKLHYAKTPLTTELNLNTSKSLPTIGEDPRPPALYATISNEETPPGNDPDLLQIMRRKLQDRRFSHPSAPSLPAHRVILTESRAKAKVKAKVKAIQPIHMILRGLQPRRLSLCQHSRSWTTPTATKTSSLPRQDLVVRGSLEVASKALLRHHCQ